jgi:hypothetical protein
LSAARIRARAAAGGDVCLMPRGHWLDAPFGAPLPSAFSEDANLRCGRAKLGRIRAARTNFFSLPLLGRMNEDRVMETTKFTPDEWQMRFDAGARQAQREYCNIFEFWRACRRKRCRRAKTCGGHARICLTRGLGRVPYEAQYQANLRIIAATPTDADRPTKSGRRSNALSLVSYGPD